MSGLRNFGFSRLFSALLSLSCFVVLSSCGSAHDSDEHYVFIAANTKVPYWQSATLGFEKAGEQLKVKVAESGPDTYDPKAEREALDEAIQQKPSGILLAVTDPGLLQNSINSAIAAGIPVITVDSDAPASKRLFFIGTNNYEVGMVGGKRLAKELKGKGNVVVFTMPSQPNLQDRLRGYKDALASTGVKITQEIDIQGDPRIAFDKTEAMLGKGKDDVQAFVCLEAQSGKEVAEVVDRAHMKGSKIVMAMDTDPKTLDWIQKDGIVATISQKPYTMAFVGLQMLDTLHHHKPAALDADWTKDSAAPIPSFVDTGSVLVDKSNAASFSQAK